MGDIEIYGAKQHNLKDINVTIPRNSLTVVTGLSGSGKSGSVFIYGFEVEEKYRGRGLGKLFFRECLKEVKKASPQIAEIVLIVSQEWGAALHVYEELGFKVIRQIPGFFPSDVIPGGADGIIMIKTLEENV